MALKVLLSTGQEHTTYRGVNMMIFITFRGMFIIIRILDTEEYDMVA